MRRRWLVLGAFVVVLLAAAGGAAWFTQFSNADASAAVQVKKKHARPALAHHYRRAKADPERPFGNPQVDYPVLSDGARGSNVLRLQQLLAHHGYLPVSFDAKGKQPLYTLAPRQGTFTWRFAPPPGLKDQWQAGYYGTATRGAVMAFQADNGMTPDGVAGAHVWHGLLSPKPRPAPRPYTSVLVSKSLPESITIYQGSKPVFTAAANTGIPGEDTPDGTWPVYVRYTSQTMSGTNPDGSHYSDPGVPWVSYFYGGDAVHGFPRASYGSPQSLGCVELAFGDAKTAYDLMSYGTLVTVTG